MVDHFPFVLSFVEAFRFFFTNLLLGKKLAFVDVPLNPHLKDKQEDQYERSRA